MIYKKMKYVIFGSIIICLCILGWNHYDKGDNTESVGPALVIDPQPAAMQPNPKVSNQVPTQSSYEAVEQPKDVGPSIELAIQQENLMEIGTDTTVSPTNNNLQIDFKEIHNDYSKNISEIDSDFIDIGKMFLGDFQSLKQLPLGSSVAIEIDGSTLHGEISKKKPSTLLPNNSYLKVKLDGQGRYMTAYFDGKSTQGKIYTSNGSYMYQHNGDVGFIVSIYEYKKLNNALHID